MLILSLVHTPLPQPDYHNVRHHDAPGEVCEHHDHLLRWHPQAGVARDVAVLHWHWFLPSATPADLPVPGTGPAVHAHAPDWQATNPDNGPRIVPDRSSQLAGRLASYPSPPISSLLPIDGPIPTTAPGWRAHLTLGATFARRAALNSWLQRWVC